MNAWRQPTSKLPVTMGTSPTPMLACVAVPFGDSRPMDTDSSYKASLVNMITHGRATAIPPPAAELRGEAAEMGKSACVKNSLPDSSLEIVAAVVWDASCFGVDPRSSLDSDRGGWPELRV